MKTYTVSSEVIASIKDTLRDYRDALNMEGATELEDQTQHLLDSLHTIILNQ